MVTLLFLLLVLVLVSGASAAPTGNSNGSCTLQFQNKFKELMSMKESCQNINLKDCCQVASGVQMLGEASPTNVLYTINDACVEDHRKFISTDSPPQTVQARCDPKDGWLVILRRKGDVSPLVNFTRKWVEYENGFGDLNTEFWYGLKNIHCLTERDEVELMLELKQDDGTGITWTYQTFRVDGPETNYVLRIGGARRVKGTGSDRMAYHNGQQFSTIDRDNDGWGGNNNCAATENRGNGGGWWYNACYASALTRPHTGSNKIFWNSGRYFPHVEMKIRPKTCLVTNKQSDSCE